MNKLPQFERPPIRIIGKAPEEEKKKASEEFGRRFRDGEITELPEEILQKIQLLEYKKEPYEKEVISLANVILNNFIAHYGIDVFDVPEKNIHIVPREVYKSIPGLVGEYATHDARRQLIVINKNGLSDMIFLAKCILHEMIHYKGFISFDIREDASDTKEGDSIKYEFGKRRVGFRINESYQKSDKDEGYSSFYGLNEAVVSELEQRLGKLLLESATSPEIEKEQQRQRSVEILELKNKIARKQGIPLDEVDYVKDERVFSLSSYRGQRKVLYYLAQEIANDTSASKEDILDLFFKAHFNGNILEIAKLIEKTFGRGTFRAVGMMSGEYSSANQMLDYLRKQRIRKQNKSKLDENTS